MFGLDGEFTAQGPGSWPGTWHPSLSGPEATVLLSAAAPPVQSAAAAPAADDTVLSAALAGKTPEELMRLYATNGAKFNGKARTFLMDQCGIKGKGLEDGVKKQRIDVPLQRLGVLANDSFGNPGVAAEEQAAEQQLTTSLHAWYDKNAPLFQSCALDAVRDAGWRDTGFCAALPDAALQAARVDFFARVGEDTCIFRTPAGLDSAFGEKAPLLIALREYTYLQILKGKPKPSIIELAPRVEKPPAPRQSTTSNKYLLSNLVTYDKTHLDNGLRLIVILQAVKTEAIGKEVALYTQGWGAGIANAV